MAKNTLNWCMIGIVSILIVIGTFYGCSFMDPEEDITEEPTTPEIREFKGEFEVLPGYYEITQTNILGLQNVTGDKVQVFGLKIGDSSEEMLNLFGEPDFLKGYKENTIFNCEYHTSIGLKETGLIINLKDDIIERITILKPFNVYLEDGTNFVNITKNKIYSLQGIPNRQFEEPKTRIFFYDETGIDILLRRSNIKGISFRRPSQTEEKKPEF